MSSRLTLSFLFCAHSLAVAGIACAQATQRAPLREIDIADITTLVMLEDRREFDSVALARILHSTHAEVRRRAAMTLGRIVDPRGRALLLTARGDPDTAVAATVVFATGQLYDTASVSWLDSLISSPNTPQTVATEAAGALGKIRTAATRAVLARYLSAANANASSAPVVGEALLSIGRNTTRGDIAPIVRWISSPDVEVRWRATWALFRPRDPAAVPHLLRLIEDPSPVVRNWAVRGLGPAQLDSARIPRATAVARIARLASDADRTVRTEAIRTLGMFPDSAAVAALLAALDSPDTWLSVSAAEGLGRHRGHASVTAPRLAAAIAPGKSAALQVTALAALNALSPDHALAAATVMARDTSVMVRAAAENSLRMRGAAAPGRAAGGAGARGRGAGGGRGGGRARGPVQTSRSEADYRQIVERWIVPDYNGAARPVAEWVTSRGSFQIELYPGDAPIGVADFFRNVESGALIGVDFSRVVPDFVDQQRGIPGHAVVRDEVSRKRLTRANVSWASAGLDTGRPGYTLGHTPQPHNEGGFTALGRIVRGMDIVDRIELGDRVLSARIVSTGR